MSFHRMMAAASLLLMGTAAEAYVQGGSAGPSAAQPVAVPPPPPPPPAPAAPIKASFETCDGYPAPSRSADGMTAQGGGLFGLVRVDGERRDTSYGRDGVESCTQMLQDGRLQPGYQLRRASLLQARALHRVAAGEPQSAFADLDLSDQAIGQDVYGRRSVGLNGRLIRAYAQLQAGDRAAAAATARQVMAERVYEPAVTMAAAGLHLAATDDWDAYEANLRTVARVNPNLVPLQFLVAVTRGDMRQAAALYPDIVLTLPQNRGGFQVEGLLRSRLEAMIRQADLQGTYAYALAALNQGERAQEQLAAARARLAEQTAPPRPAEGRTRVSRAAQSEHELFARAGAGVTRLLDRWERLIRLRTGVAAGNLGPLLADMSGDEPIGVDGTTLELLRAASAVNPQAREQFAEHVLTVERRIAEVMSRIRQFDVAKLMGELPEPETRERMPAFDGGSDSFLSLDGNGYRTHRSNITGARTIRFASHRGSMATANEMALLRAAQLARQSGQSGMIVLGRRAMRRSTTTTMYGRVVSTASAGQEAELDVIFVDPANLPPAYADAAWRVVDANAVWNTLSPIYAVAPQRSAQR